MLTLKTNIMKYKDADGNMQDIGAIIGERATDISLTQVGTPADAKAVGDKIRNLSEQKADLLEVATYITPEMYGAVGDGVTDDSEAIQQAIDVAGKTDIVYLSKKTYLISSGLTINTEYARFICEGTLTYDGTDVALKLTNRNINVFVNLIRATNGTAMQLYGGATVCDVNIHSIRSSVVGIHIYGVDNNCTYNKINCGQIFSSEANILIEKVSSYVNENYFWLSNLRGESNYGIKIIGGGGNKFFNGGVEGISDTGCAIYVEDGEANEFHAIRCAENYGKNSIILKGTCGRNIFDLSACVLDEVDITGLTDGRTNYVHAPYMYNGYACGEHVTLSYKFGKTYDPSNANIGFYITDANFPDKIIGLVGSQIPTTLRCNATSVNEQTYTLDALYSEYESLAKGFPVVFQFLGKNEGKFKLVDSRGNEIFDNTDGKFGNKTISVRWNGYNKYTEKSLWDIQILGEVNASQSYVQEYAQPKGDYLTEHQSLDEYAKTNDHYTKTESDNKYQPKGDYLTEHQDISGKADKSNAEVWTFTLSDGSTVTKKVVLA